MLGLLVDLDGTLVDRDAAVRAWLAGRGRPIPAELPEELDELLGESLAELLRAELPTLIAPDPRVLAALDRLADAGCRLALVSNGGGRTQRAKLAAAGIELARFEAVLISGELGFAKPDARMFEAGLAALGLAPAAAIMLGDSPTRDIAGASAIGLRGCWISHGRSWPRSDVHPSTIATDFAGAVTQLLAHARD